MGVKRKEIDILLNIMDSPLSVRELSEKLGDSERNLRYSVENLEYYLKKLAGRDIIKKIRNCPSLLRKERRMVFYVLWEESTYTATMRGESIY